MLVINWKAFGYEIHMARLRRKMSQATLAERVGISRNYVSMIERGVADPSYAIVVSLCDYLSIDQPPDQPANVATSVAGPGRRGFPPQPNAETQP